jgi:hypothetical protein
MAKTSSQNLRARLIGAVEGGLSYTLRCARHCVRPGNSNAEKAERLIRNLARRLEHAAPGVAASILEGSMRC